MIPGSTVAKCIPAPTFAISFVQKERKNALCHIAKSFVQKEAMMQSVAKSTAALNFHLLELS